jgi:hypothetical protein
MPPPYSQLLYRGNYSLSIGKDFSGSILSAELGGGYRRDERIFPGLMTGKLNYSALSKRVKVRLPNGEMVDRLPYIWFFYCNSKDNGNEPFLMKSPLDNKTYLWIFPDDGIEIEMVDRFLGTTGLTVKQVNVQGVLTNSDGSINEGILSPDA